MGIQERSFLNTRKRAVVALRFVLILAVSVIALSGGPASRAPTMAVLAVYWATNIVLAFERPAAFLKRLPGMLLFLFDLGVVVLLMFLSGETRSPFYVVFFLIILMAGLSRSAKVTVALACVSSAAYGLLVGAVEPAALLQAEFTTRVSLFFVTALFAGYLAEEAHRERGARIRYEGFYRALFEQSADGVLVAGGDGRILEGNPKACGLLGGDPRGRRLEEILPAGAGPAAPPGSASSVFSLDLDRAEGGKLSCEASIHQLRVGAESYRILILRDVEEIRDLQKRMADFEKEILLGDLLVSVTHELNNPLAVILGYAELLGEAGLGAEAREYVSYIREAGRRCKRVVDAFLDQCRARPFRPVRVRLGETVRGVARLMDYHLRYHTVKLELEADEGPEVVADPALVEQMLIHLVTHAVKSMQGCARKVLRVAVRESGGEALLEISDTGNGLVPRLLEGLSTGGAGPGPGAAARILGLSLSMEIARRHGGLLVVKGEPGKGTTYVMRLPAALRDVSTEAA